MPKTIILLVGPKGSGKTHIGTLCERLAGVRLLRVEPIWLEHKGVSYSVVISEIVSRVKQMSETTDVVVLESLGLGEPFTLLLAALREAHCVKLVKVTAPLEVCATRVRTRDQSLHIPVSDENLQAYNSMAARVELDWDLTLENHPPLSPEAILGGISELVDSHQA